MSAVSCTRSGLNVYFIQYILVCIIIIEYGLNIQNRINRLNTIFKFQCLNNKYHSIRSLHIQRRYGLNKFGDNSTNNRIYFRPTPKLLYHHKRYIWIPPIWLRPLIRPLLIIIGGFIGGIILQLWKGQPPQWLVIVIIIISHPTLQYL